MKLKKGDEMTPILLIFAVCIITMLAAVWVYNKKEATAFHQTLEQVNLLRGEFKQAQEDLKELKEFSELQESLINAQADEISCLIDAGEKLESICRNLKEKQMELQELLSKKRPVIKIESPIPVQIVPQTLQKKQK